MHLKSVSPYSSCIKSHSSSLFRHPAPLREAEWCKNYSEAVEGDQEFHATPANRLLCRGQNGFNWNRTIWDMNGTVAYKLRIWGMISAASLPKGAPWPSVGGTAYQTLTLKVNHMSSEEHLSDDNSWFRSEIRRVSTDMASIEQGLWHYKIQSLLKSSQYIWEIDPGCDICLPLFRWDLYERWGHWLCEDKFMQLEEGFLA